MIENNPDLLRIISNSDLTDFNSILSVTEVIFSAKVNIVFAAPSEEGSTDRLIGNNDLSARIR